MVAYIFIGVMVMLGMIGTAMVASSVVGVWRNLPGQHLKRHMRKHFLATKLDQVKIKAVRRCGTNFEADITLPYNVPIEKFKDQLPGLEQTAGTKILFQQTHGRLCKLKFGYSDFREVMSYNDPADKPLVIPLYTAFGPTELDFCRESCCHLLVGGATRMGKTVLLRLLITHLIRSTKGHVKLVLCDNKVSDLWVFRELGQVSIAETQLEALCSLKEALEEVARRKELLKKSFDCVDIKSYRGKYPTCNLPPMFVIIDEFGRFCDNKEIQTAVTELAETAGYLDIHLVVATQRPDAKDVMQPRIKANMLARICFATPDEANSKIVLDLPDAAHIGRIQGRAVLLEGFSQLIQVPYITESQTIELLKPYYREDMPNVDSKGSTDSEIPEALPSFVTGSVIDAMLPGDGTSEYYDQ